MKIIWDFSKAWDSVKLLVHPSSTTNENYWNKLKLALGRDDEIISEKEKEAAEYHLEEGYSALLVREAESDFLQ